MSSGTQKHSLWSLPPGLCTAHWLQCDSFILCELLPTLFPKAFGDGELEAVRELHQASSGPSVLGPPWVCSSNDSETPLTLSTELAPGPDS